MKVRSIAQNIAWMVMFFATAMLTFSENVRTVQVMGLFASGMGCGVFFARAILAVKAARSEAPRE
jgi:hypothetical protein